MNHYNDTMGAAAAIGIGCRRSRRSRTDLVHQHQIWGPNIVLRYSKIDLLVGGFRHFFHNIWDAILPIDFHIFQDG